MIHLATISLENVYMEIAYQTADGQKKLNEKKTYKQKTKENTDLI